MLNKEKSYEFEVAGRKVSFSVNKLAPKSQSSVFARMGDTVITVNVNTAPAKGDAEYFPMSVDYIEKFYASGKISGSRFVKRERFPSDEAVLKARMIDRAVRCRFPSDYRDELNIIVTVMSYDEDNDPLILAVNAVSFALMNSKTPFNGPIAGVRMGLVDGQIAPLYKSMDDVSKEETMDFVLGGDGETFTMIDAGAYEVKEDLAIEGMEKALGEMKIWLDAQRAFLEEMDPVSKEYTPFLIPEELVTEMFEKYGDIAKENLLSGESKKHEDTKSEIFSNYEGKYTKLILSEAYEKVLKKILRKVVIEEDKRTDGRGLTDIRELSGGVSLLPRTHGSALFTRGETQTLTVVTLGSKRDAMLVDDMEGESEKRYMHFYNDLPFAYGDVGRVSLMPSRRGIGHGALGGKALVPVLPSEEEFPYTIVVMSEIQGENGSSSMASSCGSTLALMDAGVPLRKAVAGIACGLVTAEDGSFKVLTDMQGVEDFYGDMDFKVTGTDEGITAIQMDTKTDGLSMEIVKRTFEQSREARLKILEFMKGIIDAPRGEISQYAPKVATSKIPVDKIGELIGPGGKNIRELSERSGAEITIDEDGTVNVYATSQEAIDIAMKSIEGYSFEPKVGEIYDGEVASVMDYGAFVDIVPGVSGLVHVSELSNEFVKDIRSIVKEGDKLKVKLVAIDDQGRLKLSAKQAISSES